MKVLLLDGTTSHDSEAIELAADTDTELRARGCRLEEYRLRDLSLNNCRGCFGCWYKSPGECIQEDSAVDIAKSLVRSDLMVLVTRTTFGGYSSLIKSALDRTISVISPFFISTDGVTRHEKRYETYPALAVIGLSGEPARLGRGLASPGLGGPALNGRGLASPGLGGPDPEAESIFRELVARNAFNFHSPSFAVGLVRAGTPSEERIKIIGNTLESLGVGFRS